MTEKVFPIGQFGVAIDQAVMQLGGYINAHAHLDRAGTLDHKYLKHYGLTPLEATSATLPQKQNLTGELHKSLAYNEQDLFKRIEFYLKESASQNIKQIDTFIDTTTDIGRTAINVAIKLKELQSKNIKVRLAAHPIFGFKRADRWELFEEVCRDKNVDIIGGLPEKDARQNSIGFRAHLQRIISLGIELHKEVHIHVDQSNDPNEHGTLDVLRAVYGLGVPEIKGYEKPTIWVIHSISPSCYPENEFKSIVKEMSDFGIGIICCPRAALSMRQYRQNHTPTHNSIARILEMAYAGIPVRLGTDNIADMFVPTGTSSILNETLILADVLRFYNVQVLAKLASGISLNETDKEIIRRHLLEDAKAMRYKDHNFKLCIE